MKVLFDTNVYVSEALVGGLAEQIIEAVVASRAKVFVSDFILSEVERVLFERLGISPRLAKLSRRRIGRRAEMIEPASLKHRVPRDPQDSPILQAALSAGVDFLVSDDRHLLDLNPYEGIRIVSMREFADLLRDSGRLR